MMGKCAFIFPGQGSQQVGMLSDYRAEPLVIEVFAEASAVLDVDLFALITDGPTTVLNQTEHTQPALLTASVALWRLWCARQCDDAHHTQPAFMAGHSLGEYSALVCAGALSFQEAVALVRQRGLCMQQAVPTGAGAMAAILGLTADAVATVCTQAAAEHSGIVEAVNFNAPDQIVIAGHQPAVRHAMTLAETAGAKKTLLLPVSVPSHCTLMQSAAGKFKAALAKTNLLPPTIPVIQNVSADVCSDPEAIRDNLIHQLYRPVRWVDTVQTMYQSGVVHFIECGPGKVLSGLNKRIVRQALVTSLASQAAMNELLVRPAQQP